MSHLSVEITRRCNLKCAHCCRGDTQNVDIDYKYIDLLLDQVDYIYHLTFTGGEPTLNVPAIQYFIDQCKEKNVKVDYVSIITNGIRIKQDFIDVCIDLHTSTRGTDVWVSTDEYHSSQKKADISLLQKMPFYKGPKIRNGTILSEGRGRYLPESASHGAKGAAFTYTTHFTDKGHYFMLNALGEMISNIDTSYDRQNQFKMCDVKDLIRFYTFLELKQMTDNKFVEEDWERIPYTDKMYLYEREREIWEEYQEWMDRQDRLPAEINIIIPDSLEYDRKRQKVNRES